MSDHDTQLVQTRTDEAFERPISLIDATRPQIRDSAEESRHGSRSPSWRNLTKRPTKDSVREGLARWKYSKWQQDRYVSSLVQNEGDGGGARELEGSRASSPKPLPKDGVDSTQVDTSDFAPRQASEERGRRRVKESQEGAAKTKDLKRPYEFDVLYENQRGWFFFGIPLYSHSSLLNFDPAPWISKDGKDSPVNITNAQLPDPSWEWAWKSWYVDMSHDVDEEGWQYSFSFSKKFSWHGTHPWFHCFVRRRRWLRKRNKKQEMKTTDASEMGVAHTLTSDYFTIHTKRGRSPGSGFDNNTNRESSHTSRRTAEEVEMPPEDIKNIPSLFKALRLATIDREKIDAVKRFVDTGGDELIYLEEHMPEIMGFLVFQVSRRYLLEYLKRTANDVSNTLSVGDGEKRGKYLQNALRTADNQINGLEYWSDRQHVLHMAKKNGKGRQAMFSESSTMAVPKDNNPVDVIKGISGEAEIGVDPTKRVMSPSPEGRDASTHVNGGVPEIEASGGDAEPGRDGGEGAETPRSLPYDSIKVDD